eukprot:jgi/Bigna1/146505/aug1.115_g21213
MAEELTLYTEYTHGRTCFVALPPTAFPHLTESLSEPIPLKLEWSNIKRGEEVNHKAFVGWGGGRIKDGGGRRIAIPMQLAHCLEIKENVLLRVTALPGIPTSRMVRVEPESADDWEILELNAAYVEEKLLDQISVLTDGKRFPFWIRNNQLIYLRSFESSSSSSTHAGGGIMGSGFAKIAAHSEISVAPKLRGKSGSGARKADDANAVGKGQKDITTLGVQARVQPLPPLNHNYHNNKSHKHKNCDDEYNDNGRCKKEDWGKDDANDASNTLQRQRAVFVSERMLKEQLGCKEGDLVTLVTRNHRLLHQVILPRTLREHLAIPLFSRCKISKLSKRKKSMSKRGRGRGGEAIFSKRIRSITLHLVIWRNSPSAHLESLSSAALVGNGGGEVLPQLRVSTEFEIAVVSAFRKWVGTHDKAVPVIDGAVIALNVQGKLRSFAIRINQSPRSSSG